MTTREPVSPAPDTEALRQQVEELRDLIHEAAVRGIKDWDRDYDSRAAGPVTDYVLGVLHFVLGNRDKPEAGLRADLDRARADLAQAVQMVKVCIGHPDTGLEPHSELIRKARASGACPIPDDAAERVANAIEDVYGTYRRTPDERPLLRYARAAIAEINRYLADLGATPTTDPAPAAAGSTHEEWAVWYGGPDPYNAAGIESYDDEDDARENLQWYRSDLGSGIAVRTVTRSTWRVVGPAAPQDPAEPTDEGGHRVAVKRSTTDHLFWMADCKDCPDSYGGNAREVADWAVEHTFATTPPDSPAAREGAATPDGYNDDLIPPRPVAPQCPDCREGPATDPRYVINSQRVCADCWAEVEANGADPEEV